MNNIYILPCLEKSWQWSTFFIVELKPPTSNGGMKLNDWNSLDGFKLWHDRWIGSLQSFYAEVWGLTPTGKVIVWEMVSSPLSAACFGDRTCMDPAATDLSTSSHNSSLARRLALVQETAWQRWHESNASSACPHRSQTDITQASLRDLVNKCTRDELAQRLDWTR